MSRKYEQPQEREAPGRGMGAEGKDVVTTHPAYGMIGVSRVSASGGGYSLYGSDFRHTHFLSLKITRGSVRRGLNRDWYSDGEQLISVEMTESQWAAFISTPNSGVGTPCTLSWVTGEGDLPLIPNPPERHEQFGGELKAALEQAVKRLSDLQEVINTDGGKTAAGRDKIKEAAFFAKRAVADSAPWVAKMFEEHMEVRTDQAKTEVAAYIEQAIQRRGLEALGAKSPIQLRGETDGGAGTDE